MSSANFFGTNSPLVNLFLETYDGDYTKAPSNDQLKKIMMEKTYKEGAAENAIAPQFMELIISAADTWRKLDKHSQDSELNKRKKQIENDLKGLVDGNTESATNGEEAWKDADAARDTIKAAAKTILGNKYDTIINGLDNNRFRLLDNGTTINFPDNMTDNELAVVLLLEDDTLQALASIDLQSASNNTTNSSLKTDKSPWAGSTGENYIGIVDEVKNGTMKGLSMKAWSEIVSKNDGIHPIGSFSNPNGDDWRYNLKKNNGNLLFASVLPALQGKATFNGNEITSLNEVFTEIQGLDVDDNAVNDKPILALGGMIYKEAKDAAKAAKNDEIGAESGLFKALINNVSPENKTIDDSMFSDNDLSNDMAKMKIGRDKDGLYYLDNDKKERDWKNLHNDSKIFLSDCIIKGDKVGLAKCLEANSNFYSKAIAELANMDPKAVLYMCQKLELVKKSVKLEGTNIVVKVPCPFDEWMQYLRSKPEHNKYVMTLESKPAGEALQSYIKGVIEYLTKEKRILNEKLTDEVYSEKVESGLKVGTDKSGNPRMIPRFVVPEGLKERMSQSKDLYGSHMITHQGQNVRFPIYQNMYIGQSGGSTTASFIQTGGDYDKSRQSSVHEHTLKKIMSNLETVGFTVKKADIDQIDKYISDLRDTETKLEKLFTIMKKFESLARSYGYDDLLRSEDDLDVQSLDFSKITNQKDMKAYLYNSIKDVKSVMNQSVKLQNSMNNNLQKHVFSRLLSAVSPSNNASDYEKFN